MPMISPEEWEKSRLRIRLTGKDAEKLQAAASMITDAMAKAGTPVIDWSPLVPGKMDPEIKHLYLVVNTRKDG